MSVLRLAFVLALACGAACGGPATSGPPASGPTAALSDDARHRLFQAAGMVGDEATVKKMLTRLGLTDAAGQPTPAFEPFNDAHAGWAEKNRDFVLEMNDPAKARAYVDKHL